MYVFSAMLSSLTVIREDTKWQLDILDPVPPYPANQTVLNSAILKDYTVTMAWVQAKLIQTGFNTRKTTAKGN